VTPAWWERIDREEALEAARALLPDGGLLVLRGDDYAGRHQAANLICSFFEELGVATLSGFDTSQGSPLKGALLHVRRRLENPPLQVVPGWLADAQGPTARACEQLSDRLGELEQFQAVVLEDVDSAGPLSPGEVIALSDMATNAPCALVVTSRQESDTRWALGGRLLPGMRIVDLRYFERGDVQRVLLHSPDLAGRPVEELERALRLLVSNSGYAEIEPMLAYATLRAIQ
jgi:hypothetical protein